MMWYGILGGTGAIALFIALMTLWSAHGVRDRAMEIYNEMSKTVRNIVEHDRFEARGDTDALRRNIRQDVRQAVKEVMKDEPKVVTDDDYLKIPLLAIFDVTQNHDLYNKPDTEVHFTCTREEQHDLFNRLQKLADARKLNSQKDADEVAKQLKKKAKKGKRA